MWKRDGIDKNQMEETMWIPYALKRIEKKNINKKCAWGA